MDFKRAVQFVAVCICTFFALWLTYRFFFRHSHLYLWARLITAFGLWASAIASWHTWLRARSVQSDTQAVWIGMACLLTFQALFLVLMAAIPEWRHSLDLMIGSRTTNSDVRPYATVFVVFALWCWWRVIKPKRVLKVL